MADIQYQLRYLIMPDYIYSDARLTDVSRRVYAFIHTYKNPFYFGNENLATMFNCSERTISEAMRQLEELGLISLSYKTKAGGGKTRLAVDCVSDSHSTSSRKKKFQAPTRTLLLHNDSKDNKKRVNFEGESLVSEADFKDKNWLEAKKARSEKKRSGNGKTFGSPSPYRNDYPEGSAPKKGGVDATDIV